MRYFKNIGFKSDYLLFYFVIYSFMGWFMETVYMSILKGSFIKRGFLYGPFCPIYGFGALLVIILLFPFRKNLLLLFTGSLFLTTLIEFLTGLILKFLFNKTWWSYYNEAFNLGGLICLKTSVFWGVASVILFKFLHPLIQKLFINIPRDSAVIISKVIVLYFAVDLSISLNSLILTGYEKRLLTVISSWMAADAVQIRHMAINTLSCLLK